MSNPSRHTQKPLHLIPLIFQLLVFFPGVVYDRGDSDMDVEMMSGDEKKLFQQYEDHSVMSREGGGKRRFRRHYHHYLQAFPAGGSWQRLYRHWKRRGGIGQLSDDLFPQGSGVVWEGEP